MTREASGKSTTLSGIEVVDDHTVKITLKEPNATFLHVLALNFASVVPREEVEKWGADFGKHPVGSGALSSRSGSWARLIFRKPELL
jgi:peptide/nickel transport system substrate-binding protein